MSIVNFARSTANEMLFCPVKLLYCCSLWPLASLHYSSSKARLGMLAGNLIGLYLALPQLDRLARSISHPPLLSPAAAVATSTIAASVAYSFFSDPFARGITIGMFSATFSPFIFKPTPSFIGRKLYEFKSYLSTLLGRPPKDQNLAQTLPTRGTIQENYLDAMGEKELIERSDPLARDAKTKAYVAASFLALSLTPQILPSSYPILVSARIGVTLALMSAIALPHIFFLNAYIFPANKPAPSENALFYGRLIAYLVASKGVPKALEGSRFEIVAIAQSVSFLFLSTVTTKAIM